MKRNLLFLGALIIMLMSCNDAPKNNYCQKLIEPAGILMAADGFDTENRTGIYTDFELKANLDHLSEKEKQIVTILYDVADIMEEIYWKETVGNKQLLLDSIKDENLKKFAAINYGPWDRLNDNTPFLAGIDAKPAGSNFYPADMTKEEFEAFEDPNKASLYTLIRRDADSNLVAVWYHEAFNEQVTKASELLKQAAELAEDEGLKKYLNMRADALLNDEYFESDMAWMDMKTSNIDFVVGPIENYEDALFGYKAAHEAFILIKDVEWSDKLAKFAAFLPELQTQLPVDAKYKTEVPGSDADLNAYDVIYYAGDCNAGSKTIAINLPNDEKVQLEKGSRKLQLKNSMQAKFDKILIPISEILITESQRKHVTFDAFFGNTMFHEVAHGLGVKNTINGKGTAREALKEQYSALEEGKADILGLYLVTKLHEMGELGETDLMDNYVTFMAGIFRSSRFGAASAHGKANMVRFEYFKNAGAFKRNDDGTYEIDFEKMKTAMNEMAQMILEIQGMGDYDAAKAMITKDGFIKEDLQFDLDRVNDANIPVDVVFKQGKSHVGL